MIVICSHMSEATLCRVIGDGVMYRPDLVRRPAPLAAAGVARLAPTALAFHERDRERVAAIAGAAPGCHVIVYGDRTAPPLQLWRDRLHVVWEDAIEDAECEAIVVAERLSLRAACPAGPRTRGEVVLVGAGIVNLVTALELADRGWTIAVHDRMADPTGGDRGGVPRSELGATFGGEDARIFSFNEARHHLARSPDHLATARLPFRHTIGDDGWLSRPVADMDDDDRAWIDAQEAVPPWLAREYNADILGFNVRSFAGWHRIFAEHPQVLRGTRFVSRLVRVYQTHAGFARGRASEAEIGALEAELPLGELAAAEPALAHAARAGAIAGALRVRGFSLQVKTLARNLVRHLAERGVAFHWSSALDEVRRDAAARIASVTLGGRRVEADSFVLSPGALGAALRTCVASLRPIGSMAGMWLVLPNSEPRLTVPLKVGRRAFASTAAAEGANVIPGRDEQGRPVLFCSAGHGFVGLHPGGVERADLVELSRCIEDTARELFPDKVAATAPRPPSYCVRPWTPSGLGMFSAEDTARGGRFVVTNGHNTGGFSQAPEIAAAVACALDGTDHDMHVLYGVDRGREFDGGRAA
jgi:glycine/D-amino acid oxidase-like deaminating enzyme